MKTNTFCPTILGSIAGDVFGSVYEFANTKTIDFGLFNSQMSYTDDTIMTVAVADWILNDPTLSSSCLVQIMQRYGRKYRNPVGGYGERFYQWIWNDDPRPYLSWGNGSAMRVSAVGFAFDTLEQTLDVARQTAEVSHNHPEGIKGAQATAAAIFMARTGKKKKEIRQYITDTFHHYHLGRTCNDIRPNYTFDESCQGTVPEAIVAFMDSYDFENAIRLAISLGGDSDTLACITGGIASAFYKEISPKICEFVTAKLPADFVHIIDDFCARFGRKE